jgi:Ig-like domain CHU_C associated/CHU_C Type IX secretion signal domain
MRSIPPYFTLRTILVLILIHVFLPLFSQTPCAAPVSNGNVTICEGEPLPAISVLPNATVSTNWYTSATGTVILASNTITFTPANAGIYYAENSDPLVPCVSPRTPVELIIRPRPNVNAGVDKQICSGNCADLLATGALIYQWNQGTNAPSTSVCPTISQTFTVIGTDIWGCTDIDSVLVDVITISAPISLGDKTICDGLSLPILQVDPVAGLQTNWYSQANGGVLLKQNSTIYLPTEVGIFYVENKNTLANCTSQRTAISLEILPKPSISFIGNPKFCLGDCRSLIVYGGTSYAWNTGEVSNQIDICPTISAPYIVTVTGANTCTVTQIINVSVDSVPILTLQTAECATDLDSYTIRFKATAFDEISSNSGNLTYIGAIYNQILVPNNINTTITAINGIAQCSSTLDIVAPDCSCPIILPPISNGNEAICEGTPIPEISVAPITQYAVFWYNTPMGGTPIFKNSRFYQATQTGVYFAEIIDTITGCASPRTPIRMTIDTLPVANAGATKYILCGERTVQLDGTLSSATQGITYLWTTQSGHFIDGEHTQTPIVDASGWYKLRVSVDASGCDTEDSVYVVKRIPPSAEVKIVPAKCTNDLGILRIFNVTDGSPPLRYAITGRLFQDEPDFFNLTPQEYLVVVLDSANCSWQEIVMIDPPIDQRILLDSAVYLKYSDQIKLQPQINLALSDVDSLWWSPQFGLDCFDCLEPMTMLFQSQSYELTVKDTNGCLIKAFTTIYVEKPLVFAPNIISPSSNLDENRFFTLYNYEGSVEQINYLYIFDRWGTLVFSREKFAPNQFDLGWNGVYKSGKNESGVFTWVAELSMADGRKRKEKGQVTVFK